MDDIYENIDQYNPKKQKILIRFDDAIAYMISNKNRNSIVTELSIRGRILNISLVFTFHTQSYFAVSKNIRSNSTYFITKVPKDESFSKLLLIIHQILTLKILCSLQKMYCKIIFFLS